MFKSKMMFRLLSFTLTLFLAVTCLGAETLQTKFYSDETLKNIQFNIYSNIATTGGQFPNAIYPKDQKIKEAYIGSAVAAPYDEKNPGDGLLKASYTYCWARDNGVTLLGLVGRFKEAVSANDENEIAFYSMLIYDYTVFLRHTTLEADYSPGITKFYLSGQPVTEWMNPQNDGPAFNALYLSELAHAVISYGKPIEVNGAVADKDSIIKHLFPAEGDGLLKLYLTYINENAFAKGYDIWESCEGDLFFPRIMQLKALTAGAALASTLGYDTLAEEYLNTALKLSVAIPAHYQTFKYNSKEYTAYCEMAGLPVDLEFPVYPSKDNENFSKYRGMSLDASVLLGAIYGNLYEYTLDNSWVKKAFKDNKKLYPIYEKIVENYTRDFSLSSDKMRKTVEVLSKEAFTENGMDYYPINKGLNDGVCMIGRYPGDIYNGLTWNEPANKANPWYNCSAALAEYYYTLAMETDAKEYFEKGNAQMELVFKYVGNKGTVDEGEKSYTMSEQLDRTSGEECSFRNLTWSYSQYLRSIKAYNKASAKFGETKTTAKEDKK